jgi:hypothetical protein
VNDKEPTSLRLRIGQLSVVAEFLRARMMSALVPQSPFKRAGTRPLRSRVVGKANPAGSKLARKAAEGVVGMGWPR